MQKAAFIVSYKHAGDLRERLPVRHPFTIMYLCLSFYATFTRVRCSHTIFEYRRIK